MKIILSNYRYFISGGPERYMFSMSDYFKKMGNQIFPFSVQSVLNKNTKWEKHFLKPVASTGAIYFNDYSKDLKTIIRVFERCYYSPHGFFKAKRYAHTVGGDVAYVLQFMNKMSPSVIDGFRFSGIPVVVRLSDFSLICPQALLTHEGKPCEACVKKKSFLPAVKRKCVRGSFLATITKTTAMELHRRASSLSRINAFVCPTIFTLNKYVEAGFNAQKIHYVPTFIDTAKIKPDNRNDDFILYFGRLVEEKGVRVLLEAYKRLATPKPDLIIIGNINFNEYAGETVQLYEDIAEFKDFMTKEMLYQYIRKCRFVVIPSTCYDNLPNALLESFAHAKAVIASNHGSFPEFVQEGVTGMLFQPGNPEKLKEVLAWAVYHRDEMRKMGKRARLYVEQNHNPQRHYEKLLELFNSHISINKRKRTVSAS